LDITFKDLTFLIYKKVVRVTKKNLLANLTRLQNFLEIGKYWFNPKPGGYTN
jgi:hypothetical protein